jgi:hypothetical protein
MVQIRIAPESYKHSLVVALPRGTKPLGDIRQERWQVFGLWASTGLDACISYSLALPKFELSAMPTFVPIYRCGAVLEFR